MTAEIIYGTDFRSKGNGHTSTCATSNGPALPVGECDCGAMMIPAGSCIDGVEIWGSLGPIEDMADEILKQINPFDKGPA